MKSEKKAPSSLAGGERMAGIISMLERVVGPTASVRIYEHEAKLILAALSPEAPAREGDESFDNVEARAEAWSDRAEIQRMVEATTGVFAKWSSPEILSRFRQQFMVVIQQAFIEGYDAALTPRHEAPASPAWRDEYNRVEAIREAAEGQNRIARSTADPIAKSDAETQAAGHWTRYEREVAKLNAASGHEAPAEGAGEDGSAWLRAELIGRDDSEQLGVSVRRLRSILRARSSAPEARDAGD